MVAVQAGCCPYSLSFGGFSCCLVWHAHGTWGGPPPTSHCYATGSGKFVILTVLSCDAYSEICSPVHSDALCQVRLSMLRSMASSSCLIT